MYSSLGYSNFSFSDGTNAPSIGLCSFDVMVGDADAEEDDAAFQFRARDPVSATRAPRSTLARRLRSRSRKLPVSATRRSLLYRLSFSALSPAPTPVPIATPAPPPAR